MMGFIVAIILVAAIIIYIIKSLIQDTDFQTWLNILLVSIILLTVIMSIFMLLNKNDNSSTGNGNTANQTVQEQTSTDKKTTPNKNAPENTVEVEQDTQLLTEEREISEMTDDELSLLIAENYLALKNSYEKLNKGKNGAEYAKNRIIEEYDLTQQEWNDLYNRLDQQGYLKKAAQNLKKDNDYLIKS